MFYHDIILMMKLIFDRWSNFIIYIIYHPKIEWVNFYNISLFHTISITSHFFRLQKWFQSWFHPPGARISSSRTWPRRTKLSSATPVRSWENCAMAERRSWHGQILQRNGGFHCGKWWFMAISLVKIGIGGKFGGKRWFSDDSMGM